MTKRKDTPTEFSLAPSPSADTTSSRFEIDRLIRDRGYEIKWRPKRGEPSWNLKGLPEVWWSQSEVLKLIGLSHLADGDVRTAE